MKASDAKQGTYLRATRDGRINGIDYCAGDIGYIFEIINGMPMVRRAGYDAVLGPVNLCNWEPYEHEQQSQPVQTKQENRVSAVKFFANWEYCPWCHADWRWVDLDLAAIRWACNSAKHGNNEPVQSDTCKSIQGSSAIETLTRLRTLLLKTDSLASMKRDLRVQVLGILRPTDKMSDLYEEYPCLADD